MKARTLIASNVFALALLAVASGVPGASAAEGDAAKQPLKVRSAKASSTRDKNTPAMTIDGVISDSSRWVSQASATPAWLELDLGGTHKLTGVHLYSGYQGEDPLESFVVQFWSDGKWQDIPSAKFVDNQSTALAIPFDETVEVATDRLRVWTTGMHYGRARVQEIIVWPASSAVAVAGSPGHGVSSPTIPPQAGEIPIPPG